MPNLFRSKLESWIAIDGILSTHFEGVDARHVHMIYAAVAAHQITECPPSWVMSIAPAGSAKTVMVEALRRLPRVHFVDSVTTNTFLSGKIDEPGKKRKHSPSLLHRIGKNGIIISPDFSTFLECADVKKREIFAQLRRVYDGSMNKETGSDDHPEERSWNGRITMAACCTPGIDHYSDLMTTLGPRFVNTRSARFGGTRIAKRAMGQPTELVKERLATAVYNLLDPILRQPSIPRPKWSDELLEKLANLSEFVATARGMIHRNGYREVDSPPDIESNTRLPQELAQIANGSAVLLDRDFISEDDYRLVRRVAFDTVPSNRRMVLDALLTNRPPYSCPLPQGTVGRALEDLYLLGLTTKTGGQWAYSDLTQNLLTLADAHPLDSTGWNSPSSDRVEGGSIYPLSDKGESQAADT